MVTPLVKRHGETIDLGHALVGRNLNMLVVRGFAPLDVLAEISHPDVYDQVNNPTGTQRELKAKHAQECYNYAIESLTVPPEESPRGFPEIIINARDSDVLEIYDPSDEGTVLDLSSFTDDIELENPIVGVRVLTESIQWPKPDTGPQISRVDGNHRLHEADRVLTAAFESGEIPNSQDYPTVPFALIIGLNPIQEARLFRDINGEHQGMETAHLDTIQYRVDEAGLQADRKSWPLYIAHKLTEPGRAFEGMVFFGGSKTGVKKAEGAVPPIKINALKTTIGTQLKSAPLVSASLGDKLPQLINLLDNFWHAIKTQFPDAWADRSDYILLQSIGLQAFAKFGGMILDQAWEAGCITTEDFRNYLQPVKDAVPLDRSEYPGIAGAGGAARIADLLIKNSGAAAVKTAKNLAVLDNTEGSEQTKLD